MKPHGILFSGAMVRAILDGRKTQTRRIVKPQPYEDPKWGLVWEPKGKNHPTGSPWYCARNIAWNPITNAFADFWENRGGAPYGPVGRKLWVRETFAMGYGQVFYRASEGDDCKAISGAKVPWRPSIHMPQWAARIWLEVTEIRCQRLRDISEADATAEGIESFQDGSGFPDFTEKGIKFRTLETARESFATLWNSIRLPPAPVSADKKQVVSYASYPWHPEEAASKTWNGKPLEIHANPWVWAYTFKRIEKP